MRRKRKKAVKLAKGGEWTQIRSREDFDRAFPPGPVMPFWKHLYGDRKPDLGPEDDK